MTSASPLHSQYGFTMVEVLIAMFIMVIGVITTLSMISASMKANANANQLSTKTALAQQIAEELLSRAYDGFPDCSADTVDPNIYYNLNLSGTVSGSANYLTIAGSGTYKANCAKKTVTGSPGYWQIDIVVSSVPDDGIPLRSTVYRYP